MRAHEMMSEEDVFRLIYHRVNTFSRRCWKKWDKHPVPESTALISKRVHTYLLKLQDDWGLYF